MSERTASRGVAAAGALLVALGVAGLWLLLGGDSKEQAPEKGAISRPSASRPTKAPQSQQAPGAGERAREASSEPRKEKQPEGVLEVEVLSESTPLPGAQVQLYAREPADLTVFPARWEGENGGETGAEGRWELPVSPGSYYVTARAQGLAPGYAAVVHAPGSARTRVRLHLEAGSELHGFILEKGTGEPVSLAELLLTPLAFAPGPGARPDVPEEESLEATTSETGEFRLSGLAPGRYRLEARAPGYVSAVLTSVPIPFQGRMTLLMVPGGQLEGTILGGDGQPAEGAEVLAVGREQAVTAFADSGGRFSLEVPPGAYALSARRGKEAGALERELPVAVGQRVQGLRLQLGAGAQVSGKVVRQDGSPVVGARVEAWQGVSTVRGQVGTDERGAFSLPPLTAGNYHLQVSMPEGTQFGHGPLTLAAGEHVSLTLTNEPTPTRERTVALRPLPAVQGRVIPPYGVPVRHLILDILSPGPSARPRTYEFEGGRFELLEFPLGPSQLLVTADGLRASLVLDLKPAEHKVLELPVSPGVAMTGRIIDATTRAPVAGASVSMSLFGSVTTGPDGRFVFRALPAGEHLLQVSRMSSLTTHPVTLLPEQANEVGDIAVPAP